MQDVCKPLRVYLTFRVKGVGTKLSFTQDIHTYPRNNPLPYSQDSVPFKVSNVSQCSSYTS